MYLFVEGKAERVPEEDAGDLLWRTGSRHVNGQWKRMPVAQRATRQQTARHAIHLLPFHLEPSIEVHKLKLSTGVNKPVHRNVNWL